MAVKIKATGPGKYDVLVTGVKVGKDVKAGKRVDEVLAKAQTEIGLKRSAEKEATRRPLEEARVKISGKK